MATDTGSVSALSVCGTESPRYKALGSALLPGFKQSRGVLDVFQRLKKKKGGGGRRVWSVFQLLPRCVSAWKRFLRPLAAHKAALAPPARLLPLYKTVSPLTPHSSTTAPGAGGPVGPLAPPLEHLLLWGKKNTQRAKKQKTITHVSVESGVTGVEAAR